MHSVSDIVSQDEFKKSIREALLQHSTKNCAEIELRLGEISRTGFAPCISANLYASLYEVMRQRNLATKSGSENQIVDMFNADGSVVRCENGKKTPLSKGNKQNFEVCATRSNAIRVSVSNEKIGAKQVLSYRRKPIIEYRKKKRISTTCGNLRLDLTRCETRYTNGKIVNSNEFEIEVLHENILVSDVEKKIHCVVQLLNMGITFMETLSLKLH